MRKLIAFASLLFLVGCGGGHNPDREALNNITESQKVGSQKVEIISGEGTLTFNNGLISGTGIVKSATPLSVANSANNYELNFRLNDGASLILNANSKRDLSDGVELEFQRPTGTSTLNVIARAGTDVLDLSDSFSGIDASGEIRLLVDIHNDHGNETHIIFWDADENEILEDMLRGKGFGPNWGIKLNNAEVSLVKVSPPKDEH